MLEIRKCKLTKNYTIQKPKKAKKEQTEERKTEKEMENVKVITQFTYIKDT